MPAKDPERRRATVRAWYARTKHLRKEDDLRRQRENRDRRQREIATWYGDLKSRLVCPCGESHPACIQFHHIDAETKEVSVSDAIKRRWSKARILVEIEKCEVLCANCHIKLHERMRA
jgi:hypothetical protein